MRDRVERFIQREALLKANEPVLVAVSGGVDSMVLLHVLRELGHPCTAAHVDHQLRGPESDADRQFVHAHCSERSIPFMICSVAPRELVEEGGRSLQMAARELRLEALRDMAGEAGIARIALAHHADDAVETLLMNLMRGTGIRGLGGIASSSGPFIRPLLEVHRRMISDYATVQGIAFREDSSNRDPKYLRNRVRHELLPLIQELRPGSDASLRRSAVLLREMVRIVVGQLDHEAGPGIKLTRSMPLDRLQGSAHPRLLLLHALRGMDLHPDIVDQLHRAIEDGHIGAEFSTNEGTLRITRDSLMLEEPITPRGPLRIEEIEAPSLRTPLVFRHCGPDAIDLQQGPGVAWLDADALKFPLELRPWRHGDRMRPIGLDGSKLVSDILNDAGIHGARKTAACLLLSGDGEPAWLVGQRISAEHAARPASKHVWRVEWVG